MNIFLFTFTCLVEEKYSVLACIWYSTLICYRKSHGLSGRTLRKIPFLAHARHVQVCSSCKLEGFCALPSQIHFARVFIFDTRMGSLPLTRIENVFLNFACMSYTMCASLPIPNYAFTVGCVLVFWHVFRCDLRCNATQRSLWVFFEAELGKILRIITY